MLLHLLDRLLDERVGQAEVLPEQQRGNDLEEEAGAGGRQGGAVYQPHAHLNNRQAKKQSKSFTYMVWKGDILRPYK